MTSSIERASTVTVSAAGWRRALLVPAVAGFGAGMGVAAVFAHHLILFVLGLVVMLAAAVASAVVFPDAPSTD